MDRSAGRSYQGCVARWQPGWFWRHAALKPVGVFGLIDRHGAEGNDNKALHRALKADAIRIAEAAGFVVEGESGLAVSLAAPVSTL